MGRKKKEETDEDQEIEEDDEQEEEQVEEETPDTEELTKEELIKEEKRIRAKLDKIEGEERYNNFLKEAPTRMDDMESRIGALVAVVDRLKEDFRILLDK